MIDLHIHTNASSDGQHTPREIFAMARGKGLRAIAFADHNSVANVEEGLRLSGEFGIELIPCMELNTFHNGLDLHLLAFYIPPRHPALQDWLQFVHQKKQEQAEKRVVKLNELGFIFDWADLRQFSTDRIPTGMSFLKAILSRKENLNDARLRPYIDGNRSRSPYVNFYRDFLRGGKPAFVQMEDISTVQAIQKIKELGGIPILAHPSDTGKKNLRQLVENGLEGLEVYSPYHDAWEQEAFRIFAQKHNLLITAGSDFHGKTIKPDVELGEVAGNHYELLGQLKEHRRKNDENKKN
jgi:predicted metal-dependent phosphoesterase TrpH